MGEMVIFIIIVINNLAQVFILTLRLIAIILS